MIKACENCAHARIVTQDLSKRICRGAPPQMIAIPAGPASVQLQSHWPLVDAKDQGCGMYKEKPQLLDIAPGMLVKQ